MIAQLLNRSFLLSAADDTRLALRTSLGERQRRGGAGERSPLDEISDADIQEVIQALAALDVPRGDDSSDEGVPPKDDLLFMPRDPLLSILQTVIDDVASEQRPDAIVDRAAIAERRDVGAPSPIGVDRTFAIPLVPAGDGRRAWGAFEVTRPKVFSDPRWVWSGVVILWHRQKEKAAFVDRPADPITIADDARIVLVGDWGSGIERARAVAREMRKVLDEGRANRREQYVVHLGDVYYTGGKEEYDRRFLDPWPVTNGDDIGCFSLMGNHDMYQGGHHYYDTCLVDPRFKRQQGSSFFALRNTNWQFLALDTAYEDKSLAGGQSDWIRTQLDGYPEHKTVLLSHHQLFSAYEPVEGPLQEQIQPILDSGRVDAWFWAHEHRCLVYDEHRGVRFSSCVGHGGIPEYLIAKEGDPVPQPLSYDYRLKHGHGLEPFNTFGFAVLDLDGSSMRVTYVDEHGNRHHTVQVPGR